MWLCEECGLEFSDPNTEEQTWEYTIVSVDCCPECGSHNIIDIEERV